MKILFLATGFAPYLFSENIVNSKLVTIFLNKGLDVRVISKKDEGPIYGSDWSEWKSLKNITYEITYINNKYIDYIRSFLKFKYFIPGLRWNLYVVKLIEKLQEKYKFDLIISRSPDDSSHLAALYISKKYNIPWIANFNDPMINIWPAPYTKKINFIENIFYNHYFNKIFQNANYLTFPSKELANYIKRYYHLDEQKIHIIPHIGLENNVLPQNNIIKNNTIKMCHSGNLSKERNPELIIKAFSKLIKKYKSYKLYLDFIGNSDKSFKNLVKKYKLNDNIRFIGPFKYKESLKIMKNYNVLLLVEAILKEGIFLPSKFIDYAMLNVPICAITPKNSVVMNYINTYGGGEVADSSKEQDIYYKMDIMINNVINNNIENYNTKILYENFKPSNIIFHYEKIFKELF